MGGAFLKQEAKVYFGLKGTLEVFDKLASEFMKATGKADVLNRAKVAAENASSKEKDAALYYVRHMGLALEKGIDWFKTEHDRIKWMLDERPKMLSSDKNK